MTGHDLHALCLLCLFWAIYIRFHVVWGDGCPAETGCLGDVEEGGGCSWRNGAISGTAGGDMVAPKKSKKGAHRAKKCKNGWGAGPRNGSFKPRTLAFCIFLSPWKSYRQSWQFGFNSIWTDMNRYYHILSPCIDLSFSIVVRRG